MIDPGPHLPPFAPFIRDAEAARRLPWHVASRRLLDYLLVLVKEGECSFTVDGLSHTLGPGDFCLVQPGQMVELRGLSVTQTPYAHFDLFYNAARQESFATRPGQLDLTALRHLQQPALDRLTPQMPAVFREPAMCGWRERFERLVLSWSSQEYLARLRAEADLGSLVLEIAQFFAPHSGARPQERSLDWIPSYLSTHLADKVTVGMLAKKARLSPSRFQYVFSAKYGMSPARYVQDMRVRHAEELLLNTDWTLDHISGLCGFANVHHFARVFRKHRLNPPGRFRAARPAANLQS